MKEQREHYEREILLAAFRRIFGTDHPSVVVLAMEHRPATWHLVNRVYDEVMCEQRAARTAKAKEVAD